MKNVNKLFEYIVVTACKNEEENLYNIIESVVSQSVRPKLWVIVDDGSTDSTFQILNNADQRYKWIKSIRLDGSNVRDLGLHLASVMKKGFDFAIHYCKENNINYQYLCNLDADLILDPKFFENIMNEFNKDPELGIASGGTKHIIGNKVKIAEVSVEEPSGGHMVIRKECFEDIGGIPVSYACDSVLKAKARLRGWKTRRFEKNLATEIRDVGSADGYWKGYKHKGKASYYLNLHPIHIFYRFAKLSFSKQFYLGFAYLWGYIINALQREEKTIDPEVARYFRNKWKNILKARLK